MRLAPDELKYGVKPALLIDCADQLCDRGEEFTFADFCRALGAPEVEAEPVLTAMIADGMIEADARVNDRFHKTKTLSQLALASISLGMSRNAAEKLLQAVLKRAEEINADPATYPYSVACLVVFGSYLSDLTLLSDLDIGVGLGVGRKRSYDEVRADVQGMSRGRRSSESKTWSALRLRKPKVISLHSLSEVVDLGTPYRLVWGSLPADVVTAQ